MVNIKISNNFSFRVYFFYFVFFEHININHWIDLLMYCYLSNGLLGSIR